MSGWSEAIDCAFRIDLDYPVDVKLLVVLLLVVVERVKELLLVALSLFASGIKHLVHLVLVSATHFSKFFLPLTIVIGVSSSHRHGLK